MVRPSVRALAAASVVAVSGCTGATDLADDSLPGSDVPALAQVLMFATFNSTSVLPARPDLPTSTAGWGMDFEAEVRCPGGGRVGLAASLVVWDAEGRAEYGLRQIHEDCGGSSGVSRVRVSGGPPLVADVTVLRPDDGRVTWSGRVDGEVTWASEGRRGRCMVQIDFTGSGTVDGPTSADLVGSLCGHSLEHTVPIG